MKQEKGKGMWTPSDKDLLETDRKRSYYKELCAVYGETLSISQIASFMGRSVDYARRAMRNVPRMGGTCNFRALDVAKELTVRELQHKTKRSGFRTAGSRR